MSPDDTALVLKALREYADARAVLADQYDRWAVKALSLLSPTGEEWHAHYTELAAEARHQRQLATDLHDRLAARTTT